MILLDSAFEVFMSTQLPDGAGPGAIKSDLSSPVDLAVRVWGMAADGRPFTQDAVLNKLSREGRGRPVTRDLRRGNHPGTVRS